MTKWTSKNVKHNHIEMSESIGLTKMCVIDFSLQKSNNRLTTFNPKIASLIPTSPLYTKNFDL